jgi:hypothetical protein
MEFHQWLPICETFGSRLKELDGASPERQIAGLKSLSQHRLDFVKTNALAAKLGAVISSLPEDCVLQCGPTLNVALLSSLCVPKTLSELMR